MSAIESFTVGPHQIVRGNKTSLVNSRYAEVKIGRGRFLVLNASVISPSSQTHAVPAKIVYTWLTSGGDESEDVIVNGYTGANNDLVANNFEVIGPGKLSGWCEDPTIIYWFQFTYRRADIERGGLFG